MELVVLRHGEAGKRVAAVGQDTERSLTVSGREEVTLVAGAMKGLKLRFDVIATSPLARALETARAMGKTLKKEGSFEVWDELKPEEDRSALYLRLGRLKPDARVLIVGHEPYLSEMIGEIIGSAGVRIALKKAGVAKVELSSLDPLPSGELRWLLTTKLLKRIA